MAGAYPGFISMKHLGVLLLPLGQDASPSCMSPVPIYKPGWREAKCSKAPCLREQSNGQGLNPAPPDPEFEVLTTRPHASKIIKVCTLNSRLPAAVWPLKHRKTSPVFQSHMPTVLSNDAVMTFSSSKQISAHVWVFRTYIQCPVVKSQSLTDLSSDPTKKMTSGWPQNDCKNWTGLRSVNAQWQIAATCRSNGFVCSEEFCENLFLHDRILSQQHVVENQIRQNFYDLLQRQNSVAETDFYKSSAVHMKQCFTARCCCN